MQILFIVFFLGISLAAAQDVAVVGATPPDPSTKPDEKAVVAKKLVIPQVIEMVRINETNVFFLNNQGQIGIAKLSPDLVLEKWDFYSGFEWKEARHLAVGRNLSVVSGSPNELTQAFDTDGDYRLDFFQDMISEWPGKLEGATISCGPIADQHGRLLFAVAPKPGAEKAVSPSTIFAWNPGGQSLTALATSSLPIAEMAVSKTGMLVAWIQLDSYTEGFYVAIAQLPVFNPKKPDEQPIDPPVLLPNLIIPAAMTDFKPIGQFCFTNENGTSQILITCPEAKKLIEMIPEKFEGGWGGAVLVRETFDHLVYAIEPIDHGKILLGGSNGFQRLGQDPKIFRFKGLRITNDVLEITFTQPVDRARATAENGVQLAIIPLEGQLEPFTAAPPVVESDGRTIIMPLPKMPGKAIIKIDTPDLISEEGEPIVFPSLYYTTPGKK
jgi:hypothetical protein